MAQYKAAMSRIFGDGAVTTSGTSSSSSSAASSSSLPRAVSFKDVIPPVKPGHIAADGHVLADAEQHVQEDVSDGNNNVDAEQAQQQAQQQSHQPPPAIKYIREAWATSLLDLLLPLLWVLIFAAVMTREAFVANLYLPFLGVFAAVLANSVPIGGGIVYIPALAVLGNHVHLTVSFTLATMSVGNGILGALRWLVKDASLLVYESFEWTVVPCSVGSLLALFFLPRPGVFWVKRGFSFFCVLLAGYVLLSVRKKVRGGSRGSSSSSHSSSSSTSGSGSSRPRVTRRAWGAVAAVSFLMGVAVVPNIGIGPALTTFILLESLGYTEKEAMVTGIITGGLVCWVPFAVHFFAMGDVDLAQWVMVLPGVYYGALLAPVVHDRLGIVNVMWAFAAFLLATAVLFMQI